MPKAAFTQLDVERAVRGAIKAGMVVKRMTIDRDGKIDLSDSPAPTEPATGKNSWDEIG